MYPAIELIAMKRDRKDGTRNVRRCLFGPADDPETNRIDARCHLEQFALRSASKWNFDFQTRQPLNEGRFEWETPACVVQARNTSNTDSNPVITTVVRVVHETDSFPNSSHQTTDAAAAVAAAVSRGDGDDDRRMGKDPETTKNTRTFTQTAAKLRKQTTLKRYFKVKKFSSKRHVNQKWKSRQ